MYKDQEFETLDWTEVVGFSTLYSPEDDEITIVPHDENDEPILEGSLTLQADYASVFINRLQDSIKRLMAKRRIRMRAIARGIDPKVVEARFEGQYLADAIDISMRKGENITELGD